MTKTCISIAGKGGLLIQIPVLCSVPPIACSNLSLNIFQSGRTPNSTVLIGQMVFSTHFLPDCGVQVCKTRTVKFSLCKQLTPTRGFCTLYTMQKQLSFANLALLYTYPRFHYNIILRFLLQYERISHKLQVEHWGGQILNTEFARQRKMFGSLLDVR